MWLWPSLLMYSIAAAELKFVINGTRLVSAPCPFVSDSHATRVQGGAEGSKSRKILLPEILGPRASVGSGNTTGTYNLDSRASGEPMGPSQGDSTRATPLWAHRGMPTHAQWWSEEALPNFPPVQLHVWRKIATQVMWALNSMISKRPIRGILANWACKW